MDIKSLVVLLENSLISLNASLGNAEYLGDIPKTIALREEITKNTETLDKLKTLL